MTDLLGNKNQITHPQGQATLIFVMVTMIAVLGIATASSSQSGINLRNTVYSVQSEQALSCAEAGVEKLLAQYSGTDTPFALGEVINDVGTLSESGCTYSASIRNFPIAGVIHIRRLEENHVQQLVNTSPVTLNSVNIFMDPLNSIPTRFGQLAVYIYQPSGIVNRRMLHCGDVPAPTDFETPVAPSPDGICRHIALGPIPSGSFVRFRALKNDFSIRVGGWSRSGNGVPTGYYIRSIGTSGSVERTVSATRFYRQLPAFFDEAVVILD